MSDVGGLLRQLLTIIGAITAAGGGLYVLVYLALKAFAGRWLEHKFAQNLESFKHTQQQEIERLKFQINTQFDRITKLHQHEFDILPKAWEFIVNSYYEAASLTSPLQTYPDLQRMSKAQLDQFIIECPLDEWQKDELRQSSDQTKYYSKAIF